MTPPLLLLGAPNVGLPGLAEALSETPGMHVRGDWNITAVLKRLWKATESHTRRPAAPWRRPDAPEWLDAALADYARLLIQLEAEPHQRFGLAHASVARHLRDVARWLPPLRFVHLVRDPMHPAKAVDPGLPQAQQAVAGLTWAKTWMAHIEPPVSMNLQGLHVEELDLNTLGAGPQVRWQPPAVPRLTPAAAQGFACHPGAREQMIALGYRPPEVGTLSESVPDLIVARADGAPESARQILLDALDRGQDGRLWNALGDTFAKSGEEDQAIRCWKEAIEAPNTPQAAWLSLLSRPNRDETLSVIARARNASAIEVRAAAARWMVARGLDQESAEVLAKVHGYRWYINASPGPGSRSVESPAR